MSYFQFKYTGVMSNIYFSDTDCFILVPLLRNERHHEEERRSDLCG